MECTGNALGRTKKCSTTQPPRGCDGALVNLKLSRTRKENDDNNMMMIDDDNNNNNIIKKKRKKKKKKRINY